MSDEAIGQLISQSGGLTSELSRLYSNPTIALSTLAHGGETPCCDLVCCQQLFPSSRQSRLIFVAVEEE